VVIAVTSTHTHDHPPAGQKVLKRIYAASIGRLWVRLQANLGQRTAENQVGAEISARQGPVLSDVSGFI
jgi:hypothetical protein